MSAIAGYGRGSRPVINVTWDDAQGYVRWLSRETGQRYRLLSEAEWENVAGAGTRTAPYWGDSPAAQCRYANGRDAAYVQGRQEDCWNETYAGAPTDGRGGRAIVRTVCCAAAPGTTLRTTSARRTASGALPGTGAAATGSVWPGP